MANTEQVQYRMRAFRPTWCGPIGGDKVKKGATVAGGKIRAGIARKIDGLVRRLGYTVEVKIKDEWMPARDFERILVARRGEAERERLAEEQEARAEEERLQALLDDSDLEQIDQLGPATKQGLVLQHAIATREQLLAALDDEKRREELLGSEHIQASLQDLQYWRRQLAFQLEGMTDALNDDEKGGEDGDANAKPEAGGDAGTGEAADADAGDETTGNPEGGDAEGGKDADAPAE